MNLKWRKPVPSKMDQHMAKNGAHRPPPQHILVDDNGKIHARVQLTGGLWRYWLPGAEASGGFPTATAAKDAARAKVR